jgi:hypothetical protein
MAAANATPRPVYGQAFRLYFRIASSATGNPLTGGLTGLGAQVSKDGGNWATSTASPVEIQTSGYGYLDLTAAEMACGSALVRVFASNTNALEVSQEIVPTLLTPFAGRFDAQSVVRVEQLLLDLHALLGGNGVDQNGAQITYRNPDGSTKFTGEVVQNEFTASKSKPA